jgi:hypothetical protein
MFWGTPEIRMKFKVVTVLSVKIVVFLGKMPCGLVSKYTSTELHSIRTQIEEVGSGRNIFDLYSRSA